MTKKITHILLISLLVITYTCLSKKKQNVINNNLRIVEGACGTLTFKDQPHNTFKASLEVLENENKNLLPKDYKIDKKIMTIDFNEDDREFIGIHFVDFNGLASIISLSHVIDSKGNIYSINWCED